jgi:DNA-binding transcriptional ArsR family regulator
MECKGSRERDASGDSPLCPASLHGMHGHAMVNANPQPRELMACLGDASRWRLVEVLRAGPLCVTELAAGVRLSQSCTTRHLQALRRGGIVERRRVGKRVLFSLRSDDPAVAGLLAWAHGRAPQLPGTPPVSGESGSSRTRRRKRDKKQDSKSEPTPEPAVEAEPRPVQVPRRRPGDLEDYLL